MQDILTINIRSFSYKKGIPKDDSMNGGGFVFDCRGINNPGRFDEYKKLTGREISVIEFLETKTEIKRYLELSFELVKINIDDYLNRGFTNLDINFGCTGGQHRSVYCAEHLAKLISIQYNSKVKLIINHTNSDNWVR